MHIFGTRDRGCSAHPAFPAPSALRVRRGIYYSSGEIAPRDRGPAFSPHVVPAKAGTHTPRRILFEKKWSTALLQQLPTVVMGPCFRRDDGESRDDEPNSPLPAAL